MIFNIKYAVCIVIFITAALDSSVGKKDKDISATFIILNQNENGHIERAINLRNDILMSTPSNETVKVMIASEGSTEDASWTFFPIMKKLDQMNSRWYIFLEEYSNIETKSLFFLLANYDHLKKHFIGKRLFDRQPTIIHHFDSFSGAKTIYYPDLAAGFALSKALIKRIAKSWHPSQAVVDFTIDPSYELSKFIYSLGIKLHEDSRFCVENRNSCVTWHSELIPKVSADLNSIYFAVKTCGTLAHDRIPVIKDTWLRNAPQHQLYSDSEDSSLGTINIGIPNTERGHCSKTFEIIRQVSQLKGVKWLAIVDDDTLISVHRLASFLGNYSPEEELAIGERYGYMQATNKGFSYVTGGGGIILSFPLVARLSQTGECSCPSPASPDDMILGACLARMKVPIVHSRRFHQARADDYPVELITNSKPISFHKYWMIDPRQSYRSWLEDNIRDEL